MNFVALIVTEVPTTTVFTRDEGSLVGDLEMVGRALVGINDGDDGIREGTVEGLDGLTVGIIDGFKVGK